MYYYIYDSFLVEKKYQKLITGLETRISELGIKGRIIKLSLLKSIKEIVEDISHEPEATIIVVGKDETFSQAVSANRFNKNILFGFIPTDSHSQLSYILDLPKGVDACEVISQRRVLEMDLGEINNRLFFTYLEFGAKDIILNSPFGWTILPRDCQQLKVSNLGFRLLPSSDNQKPLVSQPQDGYLEVITLKKKRKYWLPTKTMLMDSLFFVKEIQIKPIKEKSDLSVQIGKETIKSPFNIKISPYKVKIIVGRERLI